MDYYFTDFPICPSCGEPIKNGKTIKKIKENVFFCPTCTALYSNYISINDNNNDNNKKNIPLYYKIEIDNITQSYISWIKSINRGKFLITLPYDPWEKLQFISILAFEYLRENRDKNILLITSQIDREKSNNKIQFPDFETFYNSLSYIKNPTPGDKLKVEKKDLFLKSGVISLTIKEIGNGEIRKEILHYNRKKKLSKKEKEKIIEELKESVGADENEICIKDGKECKNYKFVIIPKYEEKLVSGTRDKPYYNNVNKDVISIIVNNLDKIYKGKLWKYAPIIKEIKNKNGYENKTHSIYLLSEAEKELFYVINNKIKPNLIIIENPDILIRDYWRDYWKQKKEENSSLSNNSLLSKILDTEAIVIMISTNPMSRIHYFKYNNNFIKKYNIIPHTWDNKLVLDEMNSTSNQNKLPQIRYIEIPELDQIDEEEIKTYADNPAYEDVIYEFFKLIKRSIAYDKVTLDKYNFMNIMTFIKDDKRKEVKEKVDNIIGKENPLLKEICETIKSTSNMIVITIPKIKLKCAPNVKVMYWRDIIDKKLPQNTVIISTLFPLGITDLTSVKEVIFIGSKKFISKVKTMLDNKLDKLSLYPIYFPSDYSMIPEPLKSILKKKYNYEISQITPEEEPEDYEEDYEEEENQKAKYLKKGDEAILIEDDKGNYMLIPYYSSILVQSGDTLEEYRLYEKKDPKVIVGKEIIVDKNGVYFSIRIAFAKLLLTYGKTTTFQKGFYQWSSAEDLIKSSTLWNRLLEEAVKKYEKQQNITREEAEKEIAEILSKANLTAKDVNYIPKWWRDYNKITTEEIKIYTIEHPKNPTDIEKIYNKLKEIVKDLSTYSDKQLRQSYVASTYIQKMRSAVLKGDPTEFPNFKLYNRIREEIMYRVKNAAKVKVTRAKKVKIKEDIEKFEKMSNPTPYVEELTQAS
ncbi:hypothetical protein DFR86_11715 [Acidianus sulfidivorans JP7]|uniref:Uncharacterized protein n=1 Tax=Acidianus sulfidivorans JP7 TaxID=619593 RepID=A0A2U9IQ81_9CREN|nr:hypothetical protein [Acidianus sulfidivorans]AWR98136.1 hypothetical protein DFR86_11715 [Acidianus sulfidivorans JP7]